MKASYSSTSSKALLWCCVELAVLQCSAWGAILTNRYSFAADASDSVGGRHGALSNATITAGQAVLANPPAILSGDPNGQYVDLPDNLVTGYTAITMEVWVTPTHDDFTGGAFWNRLWDFGNSDGVNGIASMWFRSGNSATPVRGDIFGPGFGSDLSASSPLPNMQESHVVWTSDGASQMARIYVNGAQVGASDVFAATPAQLGSTSNNWLGRAQFTADRYLDGSINEFRIYDGASNPLEVAAGYQAGPDAVSAGPGTVTNIQLQIASPLAIGSGTRAAVLAAAVALTNKAVDIANSGLTVVYTPGNTNIVTVDSRGNVSARSAGATPVVATYAGISATQSVTVVAIPTTIEHRYSFTSDANDSVGTSHGTLFNTSGTASISGGQANLTGLAGDYVDLPAYLIHPTNIANSAVTFEAWATFNPVNGAWTRLFDFGDINPGTSFGRNYVFFAPNNAANGGQARTAVSDADPGFGGENGFNTANVLGLTNAHIVVVYNPNPARQFLGLYINGSFVASVATTKPLSSVNNAFSFLGRSLYSGVGDAWLNGSIDEFRLYDGELNRYQIAASFQSGQVNQNFNPGTVANLNFNVGAPTLPVNQLRQTTPLVNFTAATNINLIGDANVALTSSDTNVLTITSPGAVVRAIGLGTANLTAVFTYNNGATTTSYTNVQSLTVVTPPPATLLHRYSFTADANDSVGTAHGVLTGGATIAGAQVALNGVDGYVDLPDGIISVLTNNATFEIWATDNGSGVWARYWDFGSAGGQPNIFLDRQSGGQPNRPRFDWSSGNISTPTAFTVSNGVVAHLVVMYDDADNAASLYINGVLVASSAAATLPLGSINDINNWLGRSQFPDPYLNASIDEFRIYSGLLTAAKIQANFAAGPNQLPVDRPVVSVSLGASTVTLTWTTNGTTGFIPESTGVLGAGANWLGVSGTISQVNGNYQITVPLSGTNEFFRLRQ